MNEMIVLPPPKPRKDSQGAPELEAPERFPRLEPASSTRWKRIAGSVAALALAGGIGWATAARFDDFSQRPSPELLAAQNAAKLASDAATALEAQRRNTEQELGVLRDHVEGLKSKLESQAQKTRAAETTLAALQKSLSEQRAEAAAATAQLQAKLEKAQALAAERAADRTPVSSIPKTLPAAKPLPALKPLKPLPVVAATAAPRTPLTAYRAFVLRDIEDGHAVVEGVDGLEEVGPGDVLPGGALVQRIEKRGANWVVLTDRGAIVSDGRWDD